MCPISFPADPGKDERSPKVQVSDFSKLMFTDQSWEAYATWWEGGCVTQLWLEPLDGMVCGAGSVLLSKVALVQTVAPRSVRVLLWGETGTGKERFARAIHECSGRKGPLVAVNCGNPDERSPDALFGHRAG